MSMLDRSPSASREVHVMRRRFEHIFPGDTWRCWHGHNRAGHFEPRFNSLSRPPALEFRF
jgi:hypothetical protein